MTLPSTNCLDVDRNRRWSGDGDGGGCPLWPACPQSERRSDANHTCRGDPQPWPHPTDTLDCSARGRPTHSADHPVTPKSP